MIILYLVVAIVIVYILSTFCGKPSKSFGEFCGWAYAHRGLHGDKAPENSLEAFRRALEAGYGMELDVHLLKDGKLAVLHDSSLVRMTGKEGRVEDLCSDSLSQYSLLDTKETIPLLTDVLDLLNGDVPLIVELKAQTDNYKQLCAKICEVLDQYNGSYCIESFDPRCIYWFRKNRPEVIRGQLTENYFATPGSKLPFVLKLPLVMQMFNFLTQPDFVAYRFSDRKNFSDFLVRKLWHIPSVTWTITSIDDYNTAVSEGRIPIFENFLP